MKEYSFTEKVDLIKGLVQDLREEVTGEKGDPDFVMPGLSQSESHAFRKASHTLLSMFHKWWTDGPTEAFSDYIRKQGI